MENIPFHPISEIFPIMNDDELTALAENIRENGQVEPIVLYENMILEGRNRYLACRRINIKPTYIIYASKMDPLEFVIAKNLIRRHLTSAQKVESAFRALELKRKLQKEQISALTGNNDEIKRMEHAVDKKNKLLIVHKYKTTVEKLDQYEKIKNEIDSGSHEIQTEWEKAKRGKATLKSVYQKTQKIKPTKSKKISYKREYIKLREDLRLLNLVYDFVNKRCYELHVWENIWEEYKPITVDDPSIQELRKAELI